MAVNIDQVNVPSRLLDSDEAARRLGAKLGTLYRAENEGAGRATEDALSGRGAIPGFGHSGYTDGDPRAGALLGHIDEFAAASRRDVIGSVLRAARERRQPPPNADFALAYATRMAPGAVPGICTVARIAGWGAHYLEELRERPLRYRARAIYATTNPTE